jgi:L-serine dehydratase
MPVSVFELFKVGIGPSSSHTVGPMRAARAFVRGLSQSGVLTQTVRIKSELYGSLAATGLGHGTDRALLLGLMGHEPDSVDTEAAPGWVARCHQTGQLALAGGPSIHFSPVRDLVFHHRQHLARHPNGLRLSAFDAHKQCLLTHDYFSVGGGFVVGDGRPFDGLSAAQPAPPPAITPALEPYASAAQLLAQCREHGLSMAQITRLHERPGRSDADIDAGILKLWAVMQACVVRGCERADEWLPGPLKVRRRAPELFQQLSTCPLTPEAPDPMWAMDWVNLYALAVNEENASGGRVVTAPTNGAAGIIPAVLHYLTRMLHRSDEAVIEFMLTATAIGSLYKQNASISGAEVGCQGEVGVACSMAAAGLCAAMNGTPEQVENAAEIGMEHHLGLTCDPVGGLVQIPCIERNALAAVKAINAARLALRGDGHHHVSLDMVIKTMKDTGADMKNQYKETSRAGLAVNVVEC